MSSYVQLALGLRSLAVKIAIFVVFAGIFAWFIGGSIFPGSQVVNFPQLEWHGDKWHAQVTGNGRSPARVSWRLLRTNAAGDERVDDLGIVGVWRSFEEPRTTSAGLAFEIQSEVDGVLQRWTAVVDANGVVAKTRMPDSPTITLP